MTENLILPMSSKHCSFQDQGILCNLPGSNLLKPLGSLINQLPEMGKDPRFLVISNFHGVAMLPIWYHEK